MVKFDPKNGSHTGTGSRSNTRPQSGPSSGPTSGPSSGPNARPDASASGTGTATPAKGADGGRIGADEVLHDTGTGAEVKKRIGGDATYSANTQTPLDNRAHIANKGSLDKKALEGPGSLDPDNLQSPSVADVNRWLAKRGIEMLVPEGWRFMGQQLEGRGISFNHTGTNEGHSIEVTTWRLADDTPVHNFIAPYLDEAEDLKRLGRIAEHQVRLVGDVEGVLFVGSAPTSKEAAKAANPEELYLATDGTGRQQMSWRGALKRGNEAVMVIVSFTSPIETFHEARPVYDAVLKRTRIVA